MLPIGEDEVLGQMFIKKVGKDYMPDQVCRHCARYTEYALTSKLYPELSILTCNEKACYMSPGVLGQAKDIALNSLGERRESQAVH